MLDHAQPTDPPSHQPPEPLPVQLLFVQASHGPDQLRDQPALRTRRPGRLALEVSLLQLVVALLQFDVLLLQQAEVLLELLHLICASKGHSDKSRVSRTRVTTSLFDTRLPGGAIGSAIS